MYISYMSTGDTQSDTVMRSLLQVKSSGGYYEKDTPVPIPNTAVKLLSADDTWTAASRESRSPPDLFQSPWVIPKGFAVFENLKQSYWSNFREDTTDFPCFGQLHQEFDFRLCISGLQPV